MMHRHKKKLRNKAKKFRLENDFMDNIDDEFPDVDEYEDKKPRRSKLRKFLFKLCLFCFAVIVINVGILIASGVVSPNEPRKRDYPTRGAVLAQKQGEIKWGTISNQNFTFAYIQATKGKSMEDDNFKKNWKGSVKSDLLIGACHVFSFKQNGTAQAEHFCEIVGDSMSDRLIPAIDLTMTLAERVFDEEPSLVVTRLRDYIDYVSQHYGCDVIIICDKTSYEKYIKGEFDDNYLWVKSTSTEPDFCKDWDIWQYSDKGKCEGYENTSKFYSQLVAKQDMTVDEFKEEFIVD